MPKTQPTSSRVRLTTIAAQLWAAAAQGCCGSDPEVQKEESHHVGMVVGAELHEARASSDDDELRCDAACHAIVYPSEGSIRSEVVECEATGDVVSDAPWEPMNGRVSIECRIIETVERAPACGRRPLGYVAPVGHEADPAHKELAWLAAQAHLERASVVAFVELAEWLSGRGAPSALIQRCRAAARDEVVHAELLDALVRSEGGETPPYEVAPVAADLAVVARHNAIEGCVHEAFAAIVAGIQARRAATPARREVFARIAADELVHGQLAWDLHAWLSGTGTKRQRRALHMARVAAFARLPAIAEGQARAAPPGWGWPSGIEARTLARDFAALTLRADARPRGSLGPARV